MASAGGRGEESGRETPAGRPRSERALRKERLYGAPLPGEGEEHPEQEAWPEDAPLRIGTSGWAYRHWLGRLYPRHLSSAQQLEHFSRRFPTVEVNSTYYRLPGPRVFARWREAVPQGFRFAVKAPGSITHDKRLVDVEAETEELLERVSLLGDRLGPLLFQLPPGFHADVKRLRAFLDLLPDGGRYAFELRHRSWFERDVRETLAGKGAAFVVHDFNQKGSPVWATAGWTYLRLHGPSGRYRGAYDALPLLAWSQQVLQWLKEQRPVWCYFNNDERGHSVRNAVALRGLLEESLPRESLDLGRRAAPRGTPA